MESNDIKPFVTTRKNCRISRNKKQYWKKSTKVENVEDSLNESCQINTAESLTEQPQEEIFADKEYYFRVTKKKLPREPRTLKHITSILPHVEVDPTGASYNPPVTKYLVLTFLQQRKATKNKEKRRTKKARRRELLEKKRMELKNKRKFRKKQMHLINSLVLRKFAGTQRLGRGKFVPCEKPVLLPEELPSSLRDVKPQGSILAERVKSWQKRNLLPVAGERRKRMKLKTKLRIKMKEDRKHKQVKLGTTLI
ncbi:unnamed protein product [Thelazia callipaeda]|uniref:Ribosome biogenesis protein NOP53 n=1 Tax=Thelazia callipaeda TaxID=103827 RepID=A0A0N5D689_THECL|nr:unnamed protein product [Thelazia callipaeda]